MKIRIKSLGSSYLVFSLDYVLKYSKYKKYFQSYGENIWFLHKPFKVKTKVNGVKDLTYFRINSVEIKLLLRE